MFQVNSGLLTLTNMTLTHARYAALLDTSETEGGSAICVSAGSVILNDVTIISNQAVGATSIFIRTRCLTCQAELFSLLPVPASS
jgi:hypothetical protein